MKFEGLKAFQEKAEEAKKATGNLKKKFMKAFTPSSAAKAHWNEAINSKAACYVFGFEFRKHLKFLFHLSILMNGI
jgi:hypothetical protein